jgi:cell wall-associated NlpC family hydrolase
MTADNAKTTIIRKMKMFLVTAVLVFACQLTFGAHTAHAEETETTMGEQVIEYASQFIGNPYRWGGSSLTNGTDCSGFVMSVYANFGISLPHYSQSMISQGTAVASLAEAQPGDILVYSGHTGLYLGNGQMLSALGRSYGICVSSATYKPIKAIRRVI